MHIIKCRDRSKRAVWKRNKVWSRIQFTESLARYTLAATFLLHFQSDSMAANTFAPYPTGFTTSWTFSPGLPTTLPTQKNVAPHKQRQSDNSLLCYRGLVE